MKRLQRLGLAAAAIVLVTVASTVPNTAVAQLLSNDRTVFTTETPLRVGVTIIPPGSYEFNLIQNNGVLNVLDHRTKVVVAQAHTVPHTRGMLDVIDAPAFVYYPTFPELTKTLRTWFPASTMLGRDIIVPASVEREIMVAMSRRARGAEEQIASAETVSEPPASVDVEGPAVTEPAPLIAEARTTPRQLPLTASKQPLYAFLGLVSILGATLVSAYRKVSS